MIKNVTKRTCRPNWQLIEVRHKEHKRYIETHNPVSAYALHVLNNRLGYGNAEQATELLKVCNKGIKMNFQESFFIHVLHQQDIFIEKSTNIPQIKLNLLKIKGQDFLCSVGQIKRNRSKKHYFNGGISGAVVMTIVLLFSRCGRLRVAAEDPAQGNTEQSGDHEKGARHASNFGRAV